MRTINIFGIRKRVILNHSNGTDTIIEALSDSQYDKLKAEKKAKGQCSFKSENAYIPPADIIVYGDIDLNSSSDKAILHKMENKMIDVSRPHWIHTKLDYKTGDIPPCEERKSYLMSDCLDIVKLIKYKLVYLGNPSKVIIYKINSRYVREHSPRFVRG